jgi:DNA invertase Pin-like site-specific DNA recombinase
MSDIPRARAILQKALDCDPGNERMLRYCIRQALTLLDRERPEFTAPRKLPTLTHDQVEFIRELRSDGLPLNEIARKLGTNIGRVSEAINGKRNGI